MAKLFYANPRLLALAVGLILVAGLSSFYVLPRMEDPQLTGRVAMVNTRFPGADAERVESLVTEKLEEELRDVDEIKELRSSSRAGISTISIELRDDVYEVAPVWSRIRDKLDDVAPALGAGAAAPRFEEIEMKAYAVIVALAWKQDESPNYAILRRLAEDLEDALLAVPGTQEVDTFGDPDEEISIRVDADRMASLGLTADRIARQIAASDSKVAAGQLRNASANLLLEVAGELDSLSRVSRIPIHYGDGSSFVTLRDLAQIEKSFTDPPSSLAVVSGDRAVVLGVHVRPQDRVDHWTERVHSVLDEFRATLPQGVRLSTVFEQNVYVQSRLTGLLNNLLLGGMAVVLVVLLLMGWRSAVVVGIALPLSALMVLAGMRVLEVPIHQMSVTGLIIALGLLIDNAIVIVDEVRTRLRDRVPPREAVSQSVRQLAVPLFGSTFTTVLAFAPIGLMPGPAGEFVGSIAVSVVLAITSSFVLAMTIVPTLAAMGLGAWREGPRANAAARTLQREERGLWQVGFSNSRMTAWYRRTLHTVLARPVLGIGLGMLLPVIGFVQARNLSEQFFPPADRNQFQIVVELPAEASIEKTLATTARIRTAALRHEEIREVHWFLGESAPSFYYNLVPTRKHSANYAQGLVQLDSAEGARSLIHRLQKQLDELIPDARVHVAQLEQGPPFDAPLEIRLFGPDMHRLRELGEEVRHVLASTPRVIQTRVHLAETLPKLALHVDEEEARLAGVDHASIARQLEATLEGAVGGSILEETEELPVRIRVHGQHRSDLAKIAALDVLPAEVESNGDHPGVPLSAVGEIHLTSELAIIPRMNGRRMNEIEGFIPAGVLPATVLADFQQRLQDSGFSLPRGYSLELGGESAKRNEAIGNLMASVGVLAALMVATLVLSFGSFRIAGLIGIVAFLAVGLGLGALWLFGYPFGFMAIVGTMGLVGVAINDTIVVLAGIRENAEARAGQTAAVCDVLVRSTRHVVATSLTTMAGFLPLVLSGGGFWPPLAVAIAGGVGGATLLALYFTPCAYILVMCRGRCLENSFVRGTSLPAARHVCAGRELAGAAV